VYDDEDEEGQADDDAFADFDGQVLRLIDLFCSICSLLCLLLFRFTMTAFRTTDSCAAALITTGRARPR